MSTSFTDSFEKTFAQSGGLAQHLRVKLAAGGAAALAAAAEKSIGTNKNNVYGTDDCTVILRNKPGTRKMVAAGAITALANVYGAAGGKIDDVVNGNFEGIALEAATANNDVIEVLDVPAGASVQFLGSGKVLITGEVTLDGTNPTPVVTGLSVVEAAGVTLKTAVAPGLDPTWLTVDYGATTPVTAGSIHVHAWKVTASGNATLIASTNNTAVISWWALGTM